MQLFTVQEVSTRLRISTSAVYELVQKGTLPCHRIGPRGGAIRVSLDDLEAYVQRCRYEVARTDWGMRARTQLKHLRV
jgi:excisionase family DNA binding protein